MLGFGQLIRAGIFERVGVSAAYGDQPIVQCGWGRQVVVDAGGVGPNRVHEAHGRGLTRQHRRRCFVGHTEIL
jgi:hypothetical protein